MFLTKPALAYLPRLVPAAVFYDRDKVSPTTRGGKKFGAQTRGKSLRGKNAAPPLTS